MNGMYTIHQQSAKGEIYFLNVQALFRNDVQQQQCSEMNRQDTLKSRIFAMLNYVNKKIHA